jgi:hypothetical protein|tara:strand:+ start:355 stop:459 length:105 start_codon:yes stop_codon:yes gene_type:complete
MVELVTAVMQIVFTTLAASIVLFGIALVIHDRNK